MISPNDRVTILCGQSIYFYDYYFQLFKPIMIGIFVRRHDFVRDWQPNHFPGIIWECWMRNATPTPTLVLCKHEIKSKILKTFAHTKTSSTRFLPWNDGIRCNRQANFCHCPKLCAIASIECRVKLNLTKSSRIFVWECAVVKIRIQFGRHPHSIS